jgi:hypothetical protein
MKMFTLRELNKGLDKMIEIVTVIFISGCAMLIWIVAVGSCYELYKHIKDN